jgi:hypothetical protein
MKILLLGEFSAFHKNLQVGLREHGHDVTLASSGDGFKQVRGDINYPKIKSYSFTGKMKYRYKYFQFIKKINNYDIVQLISPNIFPARGFPFKEAFNSLKTKNKKVFLVAAGSDALYWTIAKKKMRYGPFSDVLKYDLNKEKSSFQSMYNLNRDTWIADNVDGIIPCAYEYKISYDSFSKIRNPIPIPLDLTSIKLKVNKVNNQVKIFHGLSRYGFKGTRHIESAFKKLNKKYGSLISLKIDGKMNLNSYLQVLDKANIIIDQVNTFSYGVNAVYGLAMGKVVMGGAEPECKEILDVDELPVINLLPNPDHIVEKVSKIIDEKESIVNIGNRSRIFVEKLHDCRKIAEKYLIEYKI